MIKKIKNIYETYNKRGFIKLIFAIFNNLKLYLLIFLRLKHFKKKIFQNTMYLYLNDPGISKTLILFGERELEHKYILDKILKPEMTVLDIGSNIGYYALIQLSKINKKGLLICAEPSPKNYQLLSKNLFYNFSSNFELNNVAISNKNSSKEFFLSRASNLNTFHKAEDSSLNLSGDKIIVETLTILAISKQRKIDLIRMDVEGHEVDILSSLIEYINNTGHKPSVLFEPHLSRYSDKNDLTIPLNKLFEMGYYAEYVGSSWSDGSKKIMNMNYRPIKKIKSDGEERMIFTNISNPDLKKLLINIGGVRSVYLSNKSN